MIELLAVLAIMGVLFALVSFDYRRDPLREEAERLAALIEAAASEAAILGRPLALVLDASEYHFEVMTEKGTFERLRDAPWKGRRWPAESSVPDVGRLVLSPDGAFSFGFCVSREGHGWRIDVGPGGEALLSRCAA